MPLAQVNALGTGTAYESGSATGARSRTWNPSSAGPNGAATGNLSLIRRRARGAVRNDPWARAAANRWVTDIIGTGIQPRPRHPDKEVRAWLKEFWDDWVVEADADGMSDFYGLQTVAARAMFVDGEALGRLRLRRPEDGLIVPLQVQCLEGDHLPVEMTYSLPNGHELVNGIEFDAIGARVAYHLWNRHPGEYGGATVMQSRRVPADQVLHAYTVLRAGQVRGVSELATVLLRLKTLDDFDDAVAYRQALSNLFAGYIKKPDPTEDGGDPLSGGAATYDSDGTAVSDIAPGSMSELAPGEDVTFSTPPGAPDSYSEFIRQQLMAAFASVGIPYELGTGDLRGISDRTLRVVVNGWHRALEQKQWTVFIHQWCRPIWNAWLDAIYLSGVKPMPGYGTPAGRRLWQRVLWVPQGFPYFHPLQDVEAKVKEIRAGITSLQDVVLERGEDPDAVRSRIAEDNAANDAAGLTLESDARYARNQTAAQVVDQSDGSGQQTT